MQPRWFHKTWVWLCCIAVLIAVGVTLFTVYLFQLDFIRLIDISIVFSNEHGYFDWRIFWTFVSATVSITVAVFAYILSKKLGEIQVQQYELEAMPFIMLGDISLKSTSVNVEAGKFVGFEGVSFPYFSDSKSDPESAAKQKCFTIEMINTSKTFARIIVDNCVFKCGKGQTLLQFDGFTSSTKCNDLFLEQCGNDNKGKIGLVFADSSLDLRHSDVKLSLILRNNYGDAYKQHIDFYCMSVYNENVVYGLKEFAPPHKIK
jgi:hypothetical protein